MIVQLDHITLSSPTFDTHRKLLSELGYKERFVFRDAPNVAIKQSLVISHKPSISMALFDHENSTSIEVIDQGRADDHYSPIIPLFDRIPAHLVQTSLATVTACNLLIEETMLHTLAVPVGCVRGTCGFAMQVPSLEHAVKLWRWIGATVVCEKEDTVSLTLSLPLNRAPMQIIVMQDQNIRATRPLDSYGFNCPTLVSTAIDRDRDQLALEGFAVTPIERTKVNERVLDLFFVVGPDILPLEILSVARL